MRNAYAPPGEKLGACESIIEVIVAGIRKLEKLAVSIGTPSGIRKFQEEFSKMEERVVQLAKAHSDSLNEEERWAAARRFQQEDLSMGHPTLAPSDPPYHELHVEE